MKSAMALALAALLLAAPALGARHLMQIAPAQLTTSTMPVYSSIPEFAADQPDFSTFELVLNITGLIDSVADSDVAVTVFAPTNAAFDEFMTAQKLTLEDLLDTDMLLPILMGHIVPEVLTTNQMYIGQELNTLLPGANLTIAATTHTNSVFRIMSDNPASSAHIIANMDNIMAGSSIIQAIDAVIVPPMSALEEVVMKADELTAA